MPVRGTPAPFEMPKQQPIPEGASRKEKRAITAQNEAAVSAAEKRHSERDILRYVSTHKRPYLTLPFDKNPECIKELYTAAKVREYEQNQQTMPKHYQPYDNPADYIADMWEESHITTEQAEPMIDELQAEGKAGSLVTAFLEKEAQNCHITPKELTEMKAYSVEKQTDRERGDEAAIRKVIMKGLLESGLSQQDALKYAMEVSKDINRDRLELPVPEATPHSERILSERRAQATAPVNSR